MCDYSIVTDDRTWMHSSPTLRHNANRSSNDRVDGVYTRAGADVEALETPAPPAAALVEGLPLVAPLAAVAAAATHFSPFATMTCTPAAVVRYSNRLVSNVGLNLSKRSMLVSTVIYKVVAWELRAKSSPILQTVARGGRTDCPLIFDTGKFRNTSPSTSSAARRSPVLLLVEQVAA